MFYILLSFKWTTKIYKKVYVILGFYIKKINTKSTILKERIFLTLF